MLSMARLLRVDLDKTKIGSVLNKKRFGIDESLLNTLSSVRRIAHNPEDLKRKGLSDDDIGVVTAFAALAGVFSPDVAVALQEASINQLDQLTPWEPGKFAEACRYMSQTENHLSRSSQA